MVDIPPDTLVYTATENQSADKSTRLSTKYITKDSPNSLPKSRPKCPLNNDPSPVDVNALSLVHVLDRSAKVANPKKYIEHLAKYVSENADRIRIFVFSPEL